MTTVDHSQVAGIHPGAYHQSSDPGAVGVGRLWVDTTGGVPPYPMKLRNASDTGWDALGIPGSVGATGPAGATGATGPQGPAGTISSTWLAISTSGTVAGTTTNELVDATAGAITRTLPTAVGYVGRVTIKKKDSSANVVNIASVSSQTFDGFTSPVILTVQNQSITCVSSGSNWYIE